MVVQQERQLSSAVPISNLHSLNNSHTTHPSNTLCTFYGKSGHSEAICFRKHGFPAADIETTKMSSRKLCTFCNRTGHTVETCYKKHGFPLGYKFNNRTPLAQNLVATNSVYSESLPKEQDIKGIHLTSEQCQFLTDILRQQNIGDHTPQAQINQFGTVSADVITNTKQSSTSKSSSFLSAIKDFWIIDSGATGHVCHNLDVLTTCTKIKPVLISLPNGQTVYATYSGLVKFSAKLYPTNVLYVPQFKLNLISVSKLSLHLRCTITFTLTQCVIQDNLSRERIGTVSIIVGLYLLKPLPVFSNVTPHTSIPSILCNIKDKTV